MLFSHSSSILLWWYMMNAFFFFFNHCIVFLSSPLKLLQVIQRIIICMHLLKLNERKISLHYFYMAKYFCPLVNLHILSQISPDFSPNMERCFFSSFKYHAHFFQNANQKQLNTSGGLP